MKKSLLALASGAFILGAAEFVMMGILPQAAAATGVDSPAPLAAEETMPMSLTKVLRVARTSTSCGPPAPSS